MRILIQGDNLQYYLAKCHEAFRTGLRTMLGARCFGKGYPGYYPKGPFLRTYAQVIHHVFSDVEPDILIAHFDYNARRFDLDGISDVNLRKAMILGDYWDVEQNYKDEFVNIVLRSDIRYILTYFRQARDVWDDSPITDRFVHLPPSFDPKIFNDWQMPKIYDVGFLAAGTTEYVALYPERFSIHQKLLRLQKEGLQYLWSSHPGWKQHRKEHPLVGHNFSRAINSCRIFITTSGKTRNANAKYVEIMASKALLMADQPIGWERLGLEDGVNYVRISEGDVLDKIGYYLRRPELCEQIAESGYATALRYHTCYVRAVEFRDAVLGRPSVL